MPNQHIDYEQENDRRTWWINTTGGPAAQGLTVRDYFAAKAFGALIAKVDYKEWGGISDAAFALADDMMKRRGELK